MEYMAHGNRWFTELKNGDSPIFPVRYVSHNQRVVGCFFFFIILATSKSLLIDPQ